MFIFEIFIYVFFAWVMYQFALKANKSGISVKASNKYLWYIVGFFTCIAAIRWNVGADSLSYLYIFKNVGSFEGGDKEYLWTLIVKFIYTFRLHFTVGLGIAAFLQIYPITKRLTEYKYLLIMLPIVLFGGSYFGAMMNGVRQMIVAGMFVYATKYVVERSLWKYLLFVFIAAQFHHSAYMLIPIYFIPNTLEIAKRRNLSLIIFIVCFTAGLIPQFQGAVQYIESLASVFGYEEHAEFAANRLQEGATDEALSFGPIMISFFLVAIFLIWFAPIMKAKYGNKIKYFNVWYNYSYFYSCAYFLICNVSHILIRPVEYFQNFQMIIASLLLWMFYKNRYIVKYNQLFYLFIIIIWTCSVWDITKVAGLPANMEFSTYKVFWMHM